MYLEKCLFFVILVSCGSFYQVLCEGGKEGNWTGKVFPRDGVIFSEGSGEKKPPMTKSSNRPWKGKWFPSEPKTEPDEPKSHVPKFKLPDLVAMGQPDPVCDDATTNLATDFDPYDITFHDVMLCIRPYKQFMPNVKTKAHHREYKIPDEMNFEHICMNETIEYDYDIPTFGHHRKLWAQWGEYQYLPSQRWIHNLEHGGVVLLYHPCALRSEVDRLRQIVSNCIYRHIITPFPSLSAKRPIALLTWGHSLEMSVVSDSLAISFIRKHALHGRENLPDQGQYNHLLTKNATTISDYHDSKLCPYYFRFNSTDDELI